MKSQQLEMLAILALITIHGIAIGDDVDIPQDHIVRGILIESKTPVPKPGTLVDIVWTQKGDGVVRSDTLMCDILVLGHVRKSPDGGSIVAIALTPEDVIRFNLAKETGRLHLVIPVRVDVFVATRELAKGQKLTDPSRLLTTKSTRKNETPVDAIRSVDALKGQVLGRAIRKGDVIRSSDLLQP